MIESDPEWPCKPIGVTILGSTGSIGISTLDVLRRHSGNFRIVALAANTDVSGICQQCLHFSPRYAVMADANAAQQLRELLRLAGSDIEVLSGEQSLDWVASLPETEYVMAAIVGAAGLRSTLAAVQAGKRVLLANKESLVMAGRLLMDHVRQSGATLLPVDSEHSALFQCIPNGYQASLAEAGVSRILLTGSGGPFRRTPLEELSDVAPEQACAHPNWTMGKKISVDSATMMNKGLEVIEACWLFNAKPDQIQVVVHPQSIVHSLVEFVDGSVLAQLSNPDMRAPIAYALSWPKRMSSGVERLDLFRVGRLDFEAPDIARFPCLRLASSAMATGGTASAVLNAANEVAVQAFLERRIFFTDISRVIEYALGYATVREASSLQAILESDSEARQMTKERVNGLNRRARQ
jgi:1-deoxy-D-xylulose-5-phosphate reductoisomerase